ncbi:LacI family DNA-binding transcriptional regulator [Streptococcus sp. H49]|uniref:LacI family DNA-binding transcriptional regulator n=1 Tax=Streptococcus huangxiaojuni TaxID=3237239 RepID=UPI0034A2BCEF
MAKYSIKDIAELSGVSVATVSRVINNNGRFSDETRQKVLKVIEETGYRMNYSAKSLRMNRSYTIGIIIPDITNYFFSKITELIEQELFALGYSTIICNTARSAEKEASYLKMLDSKGVDGLIIISGSEKFSFHSSSGKHIPYVCIDRQPDKLSETIFIASDHFDGAYQATDYLLAHGCQHPLLLTHQRKSSSGTNRLQGFKEALAEHHITFRADQHQLFFDPHRSDSQEAVLRFLDAHPDIDGIFALNDFLALEFLSLLSRHKRSLKNIQLIGFDDIPAAACASPSLSSIRQNIEQLAHLSVEKLLYLFDHSNTLGKTYTLPVELVLRDSVELNTP